MKTPIFLLVMIILLIIVEGLVFAESPFTGGYVVTSPYHSTIGKGGERRNNIHIGIDLGPMTWDWNIRPFMEGIVTKAEEDIVYGKTVEVYHGNNLYSSYSHGEKIYYRGDVGKIVNKGDAIMLMGSTGYSDGPHLHFEVYYKIDGKKYNLNPTKFLKDGYYESMDNINNLLRRD